MKKNFRIVALVVSALILAWFAWNALVGINAGNPVETRSQVQGGGGMGEGGSLMPGRNRADGGSPEPRKAPAEGLGDAPALLMPGMVKHSPAVLEAVLSQKENLPLTAAALLWTRDEGLWNRAREQMSSQPLLAATIAFSGHTDQERLDAAKCMISQQPGNPLGYVAALDCYIRLGDATKINEILSSMPPGEQIDTYSADISSGSRKLLDLVGYDPVEKGLLLSQDNWRLKIVESISGLTRLCSDEISPEERSERASLILSLIDGNRTLAEESLSVTALMQLSRAEELTLRRLPDDFRLINGNTVSEEASRLSTERVQLIEKQRSISDALSTLDYNAVGEYYRILDTQGDAAAAKWLTGGQ